MASSTAMPSSSLLERLHPELVDLIIGELENVADISALRLTCRTLAAKIVESPALRPHLARKTVQLTNHSLSAFVAITAPGSVPGQLLQHCTLKGIVRNKLAVFMGKYNDLPPPQDPDQDPEPDQDTVLLNTPEEDPQDHIRLLTQAFVNLKHNARQGSLSSLILTLGPNTHPMPKYIVPRHKRGVGNYWHEVEAGTGRARSTVKKTGPAGDSDEEDYVSSYELPYQPSWRTVWGSAERTFDVATQALAASQLQLTDELNVFRSLVGCAMPFDVFLRFIQRTGTAPNGSGSWSANGNREEARVEAARTSVYASLKRLKMRLSLRHRSAAKEWNEAIVAEQRMAYDAETNAVDEVFSAARLQAELDASHQAQMSAERAAAERIMQTIISPDELARIMPALEEIDLGWYSVGRNMVAPTDEELRPPASLLSDKFPAEQRSLPRLRSLGLHGLRVQASKFLHLLDTARPEDLTLCYAHFAPGTFEPVLRYLTDSALQMRPQGAENSKAIESLAGVGAIHPALAPLRPSPVRSFELDDLVDGHTLIHYDTPGGPKFRYLNLPGLGPSTLTRTTSATHSTGAAPARRVIVPDILIEDAVMAGRKQPQALVECPLGGVKMILPTRRPKGSGRRLQWVRENVDMYGPPRARYNLSSLNKDMTPYPFARYAYLAAMRGDE